MNKVNIDKEKTANIFDNPTAQDKRFLKKIGERFITSFFTDGHLTADDLKLSQEELFKKIFKIADNADFAIIVDHRDRILVEAENLFKRKEYELSKIMYAMYFEHSLNGLISKYCSRKRFDEKTKVDIIRNVDLQGKLTWLLKVFGFPAFNDANKKVIRKLSEDRNAFIHYKWKVDDDKKKIVPNVIIEEFKTIKRVVIYMKKYETKVLFNDKKKQFLTKIKRQ